MAIDGTDHPTTSSESDPTQLGSLAGSVTVSDDEASEQQQPQQSPQKRFSFYDAKAVGSIGLGISGSSLSPPKEENPNRFHFYDPSAVTEDENLANAQSKPNDQDSRQILENERISGAKSEANRVLADNNETIQIRTPLSQTNRQGQRNSSAGEILRSLQETEDQRMKILQPITAPLVDLDSGANPITGVDIAASTANDSYSASNGSDTSNNPYEDTIRTALNLLRKHRSSPRFTPRADGTTDGEESANNDYDNEAISNLNSDQDYVVNEGSYDDGDDDEKNDNETAVDDAVQEAKIKSKQRQERMAKYASRLQELKSSLPPEQQLKAQLSPRSSQSRGNTETEIMVDDNHSPPTQNQVETSGDISNKSEQQLPNHIHRQIKTALTEDSTGLVSELSHPENATIQQKQHAIIEEQVQKGVEKVLLAILEASKNKTVTGVGGESNYGEGNFANTDGQTDNMSTGSGENANAALLQVLHELLPSSRTIDTGALNTKYSADSSVNNRSRKSSVVDELLAEDEDHFSKSKTALSSKSMLPRSYDRNIDATQYWTAGDEKKMTDERRYSENQQSSETDTTSVILAAINQSKRDASLSKSVESDIDKSEDDATNDASLFESDASGGSRPHYSDEEDDDMDTAYDDDESYDENDGEEGHHGGVLGPLSREAGGTTGVVLDVESEDSSQSAAREKAYFPSVVNKVTTTTTGVYEQQILDDKKKKEILDSYDVAGKTTNIQDEEATELMRTLCAHLLPFGVDQASPREDGPLAWDEENENEPGYRIIRLSRSQLRRVECAFDAMITRLKVNSHTSLHGLEGQFDENFIRELEEAERLLDDEEKRNNQENAKRIASTDENPKIQTPSLPEHTDDLESIEDVPHPEFPGVRSAGKGEMGDLEYFQLPIIFKSHVTGFEPTKDMTLEPGNIIAGQYLVESELGSAAFSTAYRCVDLSSEDADGHEEVCLKVIKNTKDFFDQSLDEIKILELLRQTGKCDENYILRVKTFFYYREHLIIVTELLRQNLFEFGKFIVDNDEEPYFTLPRLAYITRQCLIALRFVHNLGLVHSDVKPENILLGSYSRAQIKLIDFGSSCYLTDRQSSYIQSRSYRAPEVVLGLPYDGKIDVWSLGCVVAEMFTGEVTFQNDSIVSMLSRIETFRGSFPRHMVAQGRQSDRFFTKSGLLYEVVGQSDDEEGLSVAPPAPNDEESESESELDHIQYDIFQPKSTHLSTRLGFDANLMDNYGAKSVPMERKIEQMFTDFVAKLLTIDPDNRPSAEEALNHPYMVYAASLTDDEIKYPRN